MTVARHWRKLAWAAGLMSALPVAHAAVLTATRIEPPHVANHAPDETRSWTRERAGLREVYLEGSPEAIGAANARLLHDAMVEEERRLWEELERRVPWWIARTALLDYSRVRYRGIASGVPEPRRRELAAEARAFLPDPFASRMPGYQRMLFLHALYDVALSFEHSPLIGCTSFAFRAPSGHEIVARAFDFDADEGLDRDKVVYLVREDGAIPFASVAWPGFIGVVTGMNADGVVLVVHGARAGQARAHGIPVALSLREVLEHAHDTREAVDLLQRQAVMVSHIVFAVDARGEVAVVERAPGVDAGVRRSSGTGYVTNTFEGPFAGDPANVRVRESTTSVDRADRIRDLLSDPDVPRTGVRDALSMLRDHRCAHADGCRLGDRRAIDALIATHGIVADTTARVLWVSAGPHLSGRFVKVDPGAVFAPGYDPRGDDPPETLPEDPILRDGRYDVALAARGSAEGAR